MRQKSAHVPDRVDTGSLSLTAVPAFEWETDILR